MKKKFLLPGILLVIIAFVLLNIVTAGDKHVTVVEDNATLVNENGKLKTENKQLKSENNKLASLNNKLSADLTKVMTAVTLTASAKEVKVNDKLPKAIVTIEEEIESELGWCTPDIAYGLLEEKLEKTPTKEEYKRTLVNLLNRDMLYNPGTPDPYVKGTKVTQSQINKIIK